MGMDLRFGQFISGRALQQQRTGAVGGGVPGVLDPDHWKLAVDLPQIPGNPVGVAGSGDAAGVSELHACVPSYGSRNRAPEGARPRGMLGTQSGR